jgi:peptidoglycan/LPS O-acetylase OafA/YrhL
MKTSYPGSTLVSIKASSLRDFVWHIGQLGVLMFFVHTCLVLMWSLERFNLEGWRLFGSFYTRRAFRLYPLSIVCVLLVYCFDLRWQPVNLWQNLTLTHNLFFTNHPIYPPTLVPLWSLPLEMEMYLFLPVLFLIFRNRPVKLLALVWCISVVMAFLQPELGDRFLILRYAPCFLGGVIAWRLIRERNMARLPAWLWPVAIVTVSVIWMTTTEKYLPLGIALFGLCLGLAIPLFRDIQWNAATRASRIIARYGYGIYLSHFPIMVFVLSNPGYPRFRIIHQLPRPKHYARPLAATLVLVLTTVAVVALYHLIEDPGIRLGQKLARWIAGSKDRTARSRSVPVTEDLAVLR